MPLHQKIFISINKDIVVGAILYGCPEQFTINNSPLTIHHSRFPFFFKKRKPRNHSIWQ
ncbi:MAG: hypothetical protein KAI83_05865 [Thiomargarita sp.]|nr:hypothetical protein [Thiomargarita sp.]